jgi:hypothetical protein
VKSPDFATCTVLKLVHEGEIARRYISLIALLAHPTFSRITIPEHPSVDMLVAQLAVLVTPARRNQPSSGADRQALVGRRIMSTLPPTFSRWFQFRPYPYLATSYDGYILSFVIFGDTVRSLKLLSFPSPVWVKHHPYVEPLPVRAQISKRLSHNVWFVCCLKCQNRSVCFVVARLHGRANVSAIPEQKPKPLWSCALDLDGAVKTALNLEMGISLLRRRAATQGRHLKLRKIFESLLFADFHIFQSRPLQLEHPRLHDHGSFSGDSWGRISGSIGVTSRFHPLRSTRVIAVSGYYRCRAMIISTARNCADCDQRLWGSCVERRPNGVARRSCGEIKLRWRKEI